MSELLQFPLLNESDVDIRIGAHNKEKTKAQLLFYKDARVDMNALDTAVGAERWQDDYKEIGGVLYCGIGIEFNGKWVWKWSNGVESKGTGDDDTNNIKGEASDAFKRAGFMWGIGRELYNCKNTWVDYTEQETQDAQKGRYPNFTLSEIKFDENKMPTRIVIKDRSGNIRYEFPRKTSAKQKPSVDTQIKENVVTEAKSAVKAQDTTVQYDDIKLSAKEIEEVLASVKKQVGEKMVAIIKELGEEEKSDGKTIEMAIKHGISNYFRNVLKLPFVDGKVAKTEFSLVDRLPYVKGNVVVVANEFFYDDFRKYIRDNELMPF